MAKRIAILAHVERLRPHDDGDSLCFGMNLTSSIVGASSVDAADVDRLQPWNWTIAGVRVWVESEPAPTDADVIATKRAASLQKLTARLGELVRSMAGQSSPNDPPTTSAPFLWDPLRPSGLGDRGARRYRSLLGYLSTLPAPVPQKLSLSVCFRVSRANLPPAWEKAAPGTASLWAAPVLTLGATAPRYAYAPSRTDFPSAATGAAFSIWVNEPPQAETADPVETYVVPVDLAEVVPIGIGDTATLPEELFDFGGFWVRPAISTSDRPTVRGDDWTQKVETRVASVWDLPRRLLEAARGLVEIPDFPLFRDAVLATMRDRAGTGWLASLGGRSLLDHVAERVSEKRAPKGRSRSATEARGRLAEGSTRSLRDTARAFDRTFSFDQWKALLRSLPEADSIFDRLDARVELKVVRTLPDFPSGATPPFRYQLLRGESPQGSFSQVGPSTESATATRSFELPAAGLSAGWYQIQGTAKSGERVVSDAGHEGAALLSDLGDLERVANLLASRDHLQGVVLGQWDGAFASSQFGPQLDVVAPAAASRFYFGSLTVTPPPATPAPATDPVRPPGLSERGTLDLDDGSSWLLTIGNVSFADSNAAGTWRLVLTGGDLETATPFAWLVVEVKSGAKREIACRLEGPGSADPVTWDAFPLRENAHHHVRLALRRIGPGELAPSLALAASSSLDDAGPWTTLVPQGGKSSIALDQATRFTGTAIHVAHAAGASELRFTPPSAVVLDPVDAPHEVEAWDADRSFDKAFGFWRQNRTLVRDDVLPALDLERRLAHDNVSRVLVQILARAPSLEPASQSDPPAPPDELAYVHAAFAKKWREAVVERLGIAPANAGDGALPKARSIYRDRMPTTTAIQDPAFVESLQAKLAAFALAYADSTLVQLLETGFEDDRPTEVPHPLAIQVHRTGTASGVPNGVTGDDSSLTRKIAGVGVLMRVAAPESPWRCLNMARLVVAADDPDHSVCPVVVPHRLPRRNGQRHSFLQYDNHPLVARSPVHDLADEKGTRLEPIASTDETVAPGIYRFDSFTDAENDLEKGLLPWARLPALKFGQSYDVLPFLLGSSGTLPAALADDHPAELRDHSKLDASQLPAGAIRRISYWRRVPVGVPRLAPPGEVFQGVPAIPRTVAPLAREMGLTALTALSPQRRVGFDPSSGVGALELGLEWAVEVPRVMFDAAQAALHRFRLGITGLDAEGITTNELGIVVFVENGALMARLDDGSATPPVVLSTGDEMAARRAYDLRLAASPVSTTTMRLDVAAREADAGLAWPTPHEPAWAHVGAFTRAGVILELGVENGSIAFAEPRVEIATRAVAGTPSPAGPLMLLTPSPDEIKQLKLGLRPPATDLNTWDRWIAMDLVTGSGTLSVEDRIDVWARFHQLAGTEMPDPAKTMAGSDLDITIDDPAVERLVLELVPLDVAGATVEQRVIELPPVSSAPSSTRLPHVQHAPLPVTLNVSAARPTGRRLAYALGDPTASIAVGSGEIWALKVYAAVDASRYEASASLGAQRFPATARWAPRVLEEDGQRWALSAPWTATIEVATPTVIEATSDALALYRAIAPRFDGTRVRVALDRSIPVQGGATGGASRRFRYVKEIELSRQVWRWHGRSVSPLPFRAIADEIDDVQNRDLLAWDAEGFGDRSSLDLMRVRKTITIDGQRPTLFEEDLSSDRRAFYYRFAARAVSRYQGLFGRSDGPSLMGFDATSPREGTAWKRLLVPCRMEDPVPKPSVRMVLPLTQRESEEAVTPGLLVVLNEPWFAVGGLGERLDGEVSSVLRMERDAEGIVKASSVYRMFSPDPRLDAAGWPSADHDPSALHFATLGPIGHTFDTGADAPGWAATSMVFAAPRVPPVEPSGALTALDAPASLGWYMAKLRFRRVILPESMSGYPAPGKPEDLPSVPVVDSRATIGDVSKARAWAVNLPSVAIGRAAGKLTTTLTVAAQEVRFEVERKAPAKSTDLVELVWTTQATPVGSTEPVVRSNAIERLPDDDSLALDLRWLLSRGEDESDDLGDPSSWHLAIQYRVRSNGTLPDWRSLDPIEWTTKALDDDSKRLELERAWGGATPVRAEPAFSVAARLSAFTQGHWAQLLPDAATPRNGADEAPTLIVENVVVRPTTPQGAVLSLLERRADGAYTPVVWPLDVSKGPPGSRNWVRYQVLVTERIRDVHGRADAECYLGLYEWRSETSPMGGPGLVRIHPDGLPPGKSFVANPACADARPIHDVRLRIVEMHERRDIGELESGAMHPPVWSSAFGDAGAADLERDADALVTRVFEPIDLTVG